MSESAQVKNIYQRMIEVQKSVTSVFKNDTVALNNEKSYTAVSHDDVAAALHLPLAKAGIVLLPTVSKYTNTEIEVERKGYNGSANYKQKNYRTDIEVVVKWINADKPDEFIESMGAAFALDTSDKSFSKAYSLALKIVLLKVHLLESKDNEESRDFEKDLHSQILTKNNQSKVSRPHKTPETEQKKIVQDPAEYIMPFGDANIKGKKIKEIPENVLKKIIDWCENEIKTVPPVKGFSEIFNTKLAIVAFLKSVEVQS